MSLYKQIRELYYAGNGICVDIHCQEFFKNSRSLINNHKGNKNTLKETFKFNTRSYLMPLGGILTHNIKVGARTKHTRSAITVRLLLKIIPTNFDSLSCNNFLIQIVLK